MRLIWVVHRNGKGHCNRSIGYYGKTVQENDIYWAPAMGGVLSTYHHIKDSHSNHWSGHHFARNWGTVGWSHSTKCPTTREWAAGMSKPEWSGLSFLLPHEPLETLYSMFPGERSASKDQVLRAEPKASRVTGLEKIDGHVLWPGLGERTGRLYLPPKQQPFPGQLKLGQPGMKLCLLLNKGTGTETQESALWAPSRTWFDLQRIGRVPDAQKYFLPQMPKIPPVTTPENLGEQLHLPVLMFPPSFL